MKTLRNLTHRALKVRLGGGKTLFLGPHKVGQVADQAAEEASVQRLVAAGEVEIVGDGAAAGPGGDAVSESQESTHGHPQATMIRPKGNR